jgi:hypothetical protein
MFNGKSTISMAIFNSKLLVYQRVANRTHNVAMSTYPSLSRGIAPPSTSPWTRPCQAAPSVIAWNNPDRLCFVYSFLYNAVNSPQYWWSKMDMPWAQAGFYSKISRCVSWGAGKFYLTTCTGYITRKQGFKLTSQLVFSAETNNCSSSGF